MTSEKWSRYHKVSVTSGDFSCPGSSPRHPKKGRYDLRKCTRRPGKVAISEGFLVTSEKGNAISEKGMRPPKNVAISEKFSRHPKSVAISPKNRYVTFRTNVAISYRYPTFRATPEQEKSGGSYTGAHSNLLTSVRISSNGSAGTPPGIARECAGSIPGEGLVAKVNVQKRHSPPPPPPPPP